jgi:hypothetical protein
LLEEKAWLQIARTFWREARYLPGWSQNEALPLEAEALHAFFRHEGIAETDYDPPSAAKLPACPRCGAEFQTGITAAIRLWRRGTAQPGCLNGVNSARDAASIPPSPHRWENR